VTLAACAKEVAKAVTRAVCLRKCISKIPTLKGNSKTLELWIEKGGSRKVKIGERERERERKGGGQGKT